jgi:hypothetical protein
MDLGRAYAADDTMSPVLETCDSCLNYECQCGPRWLLSADVLWLSRGRANPQSMVFSLVTVGELFNAKDLAFEARSGFRVSWGYDLLDGRAVELTTINVYDQPATANVAGTDIYFLIHNNAVPAITTNAFRIDYVSNLHSGELNWWLNETFGIRPMIGVRWIRVREEFAILDPTDTSLGMYSTIKNDLLGVQIGFKTRLWNGGNWFRVETALKGGLYQNAVAYTATTYDPTMAIDRINRNPSAISMSGEFTISAIFQLCPNLNIRCGYHGLWMSEIGLAANQANQSDFATGLGTDDFEALGFNGGFIGLEANW